MRDERDRFRFGGNYSSDDLSGIWSACGLPMEEGWKDREGMKTFIAGIKHVRHSLHIASMRDAGGHSRRVEAFADMLSVISLPDPPPNVVLPHCHDLVRMPIGSLSPNGRGGGGILDASSLIARSGNTGKDAEQSVEGGGRGEGESSPPSYFIHSSIVQQAKQLVQADRIVETAPFHLGDVHLLT